ncbi:MAG: hypothetical protein WC661_06700 [Opitutaceae bacterium]|jgi:hypothetical protein
MKYRHLLISLLLAVAAAHSRADIIATFDKTIRMIVVAAEKTGASYSLAPASTGNPHPSGRFSWIAKERNFLEYYYGIDVPACPQIDPKGKIVLRVRTDTPEAIWALGVRLKTPQGEIFHFDISPALVGGQWEEVVIDVAQGKSKANWGGPKGGQLEGPLLLTGLSILANPSSSSGEIRIEHVAWEDAAQAPAKTK